MKIRGLCPSDVEELASLFLALAESDSEKWFHPHPLTAEQADRVCRYGGLDLYVGAFVDGQVAGYGMLRGWGEGYSVPSLGAAVSPSWRGRGISRALVEFLHSEARLRGATQVRLKVYPENVAAVQLYGSVGYEWQLELQAGQLVGLKRF